MNNIPVKLDEHEVMLNSKEGDRYHVIGTYWRSKNESQETEYDLIAKATDKGIRLFDEKTGERFYKGANSAYEFFKIPNDTYPESFKVAVEKTKKLLNSDDIFIPIDKEEVLLRDEDGEIINGEGY